MKTAFSLLLLALVCGVWKKVNADDTKHFEMLHSWSGMDYVFPDEETRTRMITEKTFNPAGVFPTDMAVDPATGRIFLAMMKDGVSTPASVNTISESKGAKNENLLQPYPDWSWHTKGCDGIMSVDKITIDECGRLWIMDTGVIYENGTFMDYKRICPAKILIFDLKTDQLVKMFEIPADIVLHDAAFTNIAVEVISTDDSCKNTFAYVADSGYFGMIVYDFAHEDAWRVYANQLYPYPEFGHFHVHGVHFDLMFGVYSIALTPQKDGEDRTLFFNSFASGKISYVSTSLLKTKTNFVGDLTHDLMHHITSNMHTYAHLVPGGQMGAMAIDSYGVMYYGSQHESAVYCWNTNKNFDDQFINMVDKDEEKFNTLYTFRVVKTETGEPELYMMSNSFHKYMFGFPGTTETHFRIMKAPLIKLIEGTTCMSGINATT